MRLEEYQSGRMLSPDYRSISLKSFQHVSVHDALNLSDEAQAQFKGAVVVDGATWVATLGGIPADGAKYVLSGNETEIARWQSDTRSFSKLRHTPEGLVVEKIIKIKFPRKGESEAIMAEFDPAALDEAAKLLTAQGGLGAVATKTVDSFTEGKEDKPDKFGEIKKQIGTAPIAEELVNFNRDHGNLQGFITSADRCAKVAIRKENKMENGSIVLKSDCPAAVKSAWLDEKKKPEAKYIEKESNIKLIEGKPGSIKNVVLSIPEGGDVPLSGVVNGSINKPMNYTATADKIRKIVPVDAAYDIIQILFGGAIYEDKKVLGPEASCVLVQTKLVEVDDTSATEVNGAKPKKTVARSSFRMGPDAKRKAVVTQGNFFPKSVYSTVPLMNLSADDSAKLNKALVTVIKTEEKYKELSESAKKIVTYDAASQQAKATFFNPGVASPGVTVAAFHDADEKLSVINFPIREEVISKKDGKKSFKYVTNKIGDANGKGPENVPAYQEFLQNAGITIDQVKASLRSTKSSSGEGSKNTNNLTAQQYIAAKFSAGKVVDFGKGVSSLSELDKLMTSINRAAN